MDSLTQIALGACVAALCVPAPQRRKALLVGGLLGTLPDLDVAIDYGGVVENFTMHRGFSHSLFVLAPLGIAIWLAMRRWWPPAREAPQRWLAAVLLTLLSHPLLDAHTAYGTQLWWPIASPPVAWATLFIIDPLYTLPLVAAAAVVLARPGGRWAPRCLAAGLTISTAYLGWSWAAREAVLRNARDSLAAAGLEDPPIFATPAPLTTLLWRVVAIGEGGHYEGLDSLVADDGPIEFEFHPSDAKARSEAEGIAALERLEWFADGFVGIDVSGDELVVVDLRMGMHPDFVFRHAVARRGNPHWEAMEARRLPANFDPSRIAAVWRRIWRAP